MLCPNCNQDNDKVIDSRTAEGGKAVRRRRECLGCGRRYTTFERVEALDLIVVKADGKREPYQRQKALEGVVKACYKRPLSPEAINALVDQTEDELRRRFEREAPSFEIGKAISNRLRRLDQVAYVRYASVYKKFGTLEDFLEEVRELQAGASPAPVGQGNLFPDPPA